MPAWLSISQLSSSCSSSALQDLFLSPLLFRPFFFFFPSQSLRCPLSLLLSSFRSLSPSNRLEPLLTGILEGSAGMLASGPHLPLEEPTKQPSVSFLLSLSLSPSRLLFAFWTFAPWSDSRPPSPLDALFSSSFSSLFSSS